MDMLTIQALALFRKLEILVTKRQPIYVQQIVPYERPMEHKLKQLWKMNDENMGAGFSPNKTPEFKYLSFNALYT